MSSCHQSWLSRHLDAGNPSSVSSVTLETDRFSDLFSRLTAGATCQAWSHPVSTFRLKIRVHLFSPLIGLVDDLPGHPSGQAGGERPDMETGGNPSVGTLAHLGQIDIRIGAKGSDRGDAERLIAPVEAEIRSRLGDVIFSADEHARERDRPSPRRPRGPGGARGGRDERDGGRAPRERDP